jgi:hypothetical protein
LEPSLLDGCADALDEPNANHIPMLTQAQTTRVIECLQRISHSSYCDETLETIARPALRRLVESQRSHAHGGG